MSRGLAVIAVVVMALVACSSPRSPDRSLEPAANAPALSHAAYVWQRHWTPGVRDAVAHPPPGIASLRVLVGEVARTTDAGLRGALPISMMAIDAPSLAASGRPITVVVRIEGSRPIASLSLAPIAARADELRAAGVNVVGIEVDHDCATAALADYARWLRRERSMMETADASRVAASVASPPRYRLSITALPTWASSSSLIALAQVVDEVVVQVHAVRAPTIFDASTAWRDLGRFARAVRGTAAAREPDLRVALPTYATVIGDLEVSVDPDDVARFATRLRTQPVEGVSGIVWFRLPVDGDEQTWSRATFARVIRGVIDERGGAIETADDRARSRIVGGARPRSGAADGRAKVELVARGEQRFDVVVSNATSELVEMPPIRIAGEIGAADMVLGYRVAGPGRWDAPRRSLGRDERIVIGWIHGKDIALVD